MSNNEELKLCPFCGGKAHLLIFNAKSYVKCERCEIETPHLYWSEEDAIAVWNRREANNPEIPDCSSDSETPNNCEALRKPTYEELEKMIKIKWEKKVSGWRGDFTFDAFWITKSRDGWLDINGFDRNYGCVRTLKEAKLRVRYIILNFVAAALGVERSGK